MKKNNRPLEKTSKSLFDSWNSSETALSALSNDEIVAKRLSVWALVAAVSGAISLLSLLNLGFLAFSLFATFAAIFSLVAIARSGGELIGRKSALIGLALAFAGAVAGPARAETYKADFCRQADEFCKGWLKAVAAGDYLAARRAESPYWERGAILSEEEETVYWKKFLGEEERHHGFHSFATNPTLLTLAALGDRAEATFYRTDVLVLGTTMEATERTYAISVEPKAGTNDPKQTFFLRLHAVRNAQTTPEGERFVGWSLRMDGWEPLELDATGRPVEKDVR